MRKYCCQDELIEDILDSFAKLDRDNSAIDKLFSYFYIADSKLSTYLETFKKLLDIKSPNSSQLQERGKVLEQIICLVFHGLKGATSFKSFQSAGPQYDFIVTGDSLQWLIVCKLLYLDINKRDIVIEAKAKNDKLPDKDFARLCNIMELNLTGAGLGIFFTLKGASGFPDRNDPKRQRAIKHCRLCQALFHAKTQKFIIVLDQDDIFELAENDSLINLLTRKIRDLKEISGLPTVSVSQLEEIDLPDYLKELIN